MASIGIADKVTLDAVDTNVNTANARIDTVDTNVNTANARIGTDADSASATGSLHAKVRDIKDFLPTLKAIPIAGDNVRISANTERTLVGVTTYTRLKEIIIGESGTYRVSFEGKRSDTDTAFLQIFVNGVEKGARRFLNTSYYQTFTEDVSLNIGDSVQIYGRNSTASGTVYLKNFKIAWDYTGNKVILD